MRSLALHAQAEAYRYARMVKSHRKRFEASTASGIRLTITCSYGPIKIFNQAAPVLQPILAARADGEMPCPAAQEELPHIECKRADFVLTVASKILLMKSRPDRRRPA